MTWRLSLVKNRSDEPLLDGGVEVGLAGDECSDRVLDLLGGRVLGQVPACAGLERGEQELVVCVGGQHEHARFGHRCEDLAGGLRALQARHP